MAGPQLQFGSFLLDLGARRLERDGVALAITTKMFDTLAVLVRHSDRVVEKDELMQRVWPDTAVEEANLSQQVFLLRKLLGEGRREHRYIATLPRRGYRFVAEVREVHVGPELRGLPAPPVTRPGRGVLWLTLRLDDGITLELGPCPPFALSPQGHALAYVAREAGGTSLRVRRLDRRAADHVLWSGAVYSPFFSPDGRWVGFFAEGRLRKVLASGGAALEVCEAGSETRGAWWSGRNEIVFAPTPASGLAVVSADGGAPRPVTALDFELGDRTHRWPQVMPNGVDVLFTVARAGAASFDEGHIALASIGRAGQRVVLRSGTCARRLPTGHVVYMRGASLLAAPTDLHGLAVPGAAIPMVDRVMAGATGAGHFSVSDNGCLVYLAGESHHVHRRLVRLEAGGRIVPLALTGRAVEEPRLSPDGRQLALGIRAATNDIWIFDLERGTLTRATAEADNFAPIWTPDGSRLTFSSNRTGPCQIYWRAVDGTGLDERLVGGDFDLVPGSWSSDGALLLFTEYHPETGADIWMCRPDGNAPPTPLLRSRFDEYGPALSPDDHWMAYASNESGRMEVYVTSFPDVARRIQISASGGAEPVWARDGRHLYYRLGSSIMGVAFAADARPAIGPPRVVCDGPYLAGAVTGLPNYDVTAAGEFLLISQEAEPARPAEVSVAVNWFEALEGLT